MLGGLIWLGPGRPRRWWWVVVLAGLYGLTDEFHQRYVPGRTPDLRDVLADVIGAGVVVVALVVWRRSVRAPR